MPRPHASRARGSRSPILLGSAEELTRLAGQHNVSLAGIEIADPRSDARLQSYGSALARFRESMTPAMATRLVSKPLYFAGMMVREGDADAMVAGCANPTRRVIEAGLMTVGLADGIALPSSYFLMIVPDFLGQGRRSFIFADCAVNADPTPAELADIAVDVGAQRAGAARRNSARGHAVIFDQGQRTACARRQGARGLESGAPARTGLAIDGEFQADAALGAERRAKESKGATARSPARPMS